MMPGLHSMYASFVTVTFVGPSVDNLYRDIKNSQKINQDQFLLSLKKYYFKNQL